MGKQLMFEVNTRYWLYQLRNKYDSSLSLATIPQIEIDSIAENFDWVWLMGIWDHSKIDRNFLQSHPGLITETDHALKDWTNEDIIGSPYSIVSYSIHPILGSEADFVNLKQRFNDAGLKVMVDFVPNHYGFHTPHAIEHPEYFINLDNEPAKDQLHLFHKLETTSGTKWIALGKDPYFAPWDDTFQVNIRNPETRKFMISELRSIAKISDGVRCDMAMLVNNEIVEKTWGWLINDAWKPLKEEFWSQAISEIKALYPDFVFMAEVYWDLEWKLLQMGFDYAYDKRLYDRFVASNISELHAHLSADLTYQTRMCRFIENHDEPRALAVMEERQSLAAAAMIMTLPGITLLHHGQLSGNRIKIPVQLRRKTKEEKVERLYRKYMQLIRYSKNVIPQEAIWHQNDIGPASELPSDSLFSWTWQTQVKIFVIVVNYAPHEADGMVQLNTKHPIFNHDYLDFVDNYNDEHYDWFSNDIKKHGLYVKLEDYGYHLFSIEIIE